MKRGKGRDKKLMGCFSEEMLVLIRCECDKEERLIKGARYETGEEKRVSGWGKGRLFRRKEREEEERGPCIKI